MKSYKQYLVEMSEEVSAFTELRNKISNSKSYEDLRIACNFFVSYNELYGDKELAMRLEKIMKKECDIKNFILEKAKKKIVNTFNWYNKRRAKPKDI